jgi:putative oxidoreductase
MTSMDSLFQWFDERRDYGAAFIRLAVGSRLIYGVQDNVLSDARMLEFQDFLAQHGFPFPFFSAHLSVYAQFLAGILFLLGAFTRPAAVVMIFNFAVALLMVHIGHPYDQSWPAVMMLSAGLFFLFHGAGALSVDEALKARRVREDDALEGLLRKL